MKKNSRSKSSTSKNSGTTSSSPNVEAARLKQSKRTTTPVLQKSRSEAVATLNSEVNEKEKVSPRRKRRVGKKETETEEDKADKVIDLSRTEDVEKMMIQLVNLLGISLPMREKPTVATELENYCREIMSGDNKDTRKDSAATKPELFELTEQRNTRTLTRRNSKTLFSGFSDSKHLGQSMSPAEKNQMKLPRIKDSGRPLFQFLYSSPTNFRTLNANQQKNQQRPRSLSSFANRGISFANERYCLGFSRGADVGRYRSMTCPAPSMERRNNLPRGTTVMCRSILSRGKPKTDRLSRVTFVDEKYDLRNDSREKQRHILEVI